MKQILKFTLVFIVAGFLFISCKKDDTTVPEVISAQTLSQIYAHGFGTGNVQKVEEGYIVEGDILLTPEFLSQTPGGNFLRIANNEQYRTSNLVSQNRTITMALDSRLASKSGYPEALNEVVRRYNAESLTLTFQVVSSNANITFSNANGQYLASAGFPTSGNPYNSVKVNSKAIGQGSSNSFINYLATILAHEAGHCIGFRHTDYMNRSYSCGGPASNEGASSVGAIHIQGTPTAADPNSWMLACIGNGVNRPFNNNDRTALNYLY